MKISKYLRFAAAYIVGMMLIIHSKRFLECLNELNAIEENFAYIYSDAALLQGKAEQCEKRKIDCEIWNISESKDLCADLDYSDLAQHGMALAILKGIGVFNCQETEYIFLDSEIRIDLNLLKWMVCSIMSVCCFGMAVFDLSRGSMGKNKSISMLLAAFHCTFYIKLLQYGSLEVPVRSLPGAWSDAEGWRELGEGVLKQMSCLIQYKNYPVICRYYEGIINSMFYLCFSFALSAILFKIVLKRK